MADAGAEGAERVGTRGSVGRSPAAAEPLVSVLVPVRDHPEGIRTLLSCLEAQTLARDRFEVVIGDDGSRPECVPRVETVDGWLRVETGPPRTSYAARNRAARVARGDIFAFCDSDCSPQPTWLEEVLAAIVDADVVAGEVTFSAPARPTVWGLLTIDMFLDQERNVRLSRGVTANLAVRRPLFEELGGFDESLPSGGDYDFVQRAVKRGAQLRYAAAAVVRHPTIEDGRKFLRKVWMTNWWSGVRRARAGDRPEIIGALVLVPILGVMIARRKALRPVSGLHRPRLRACGVSPRWRDDLRALPLLYLVVSYVAGLGRVLGRLEGCRLARAGAAPTYGCASAELLRNQTACGGRAR
ncbi:MAG: hypothetical protein H6Q33_3677 [Deltaproteobacteria bacterium]|nr:hypothetical protein [Deltaproteobacteria bacterium]